MPANIKKIIQKKKPTKADIDTVHQWIAPEIEAIHQWIKDHEQYEDRRFAEGTQKMLDLATKDDLAKISEEMATKHDFGTLARLLFDEKGKPVFATKEDVEPVVDWHKNLVAAANITSVGGKWISRIVLWLAAFGLALGVITGGIKAALVSLMSWALPK